MNSIHFHNWRTSVPRLGAVLFAATALWFSVGCSQDQSEQAGEHDGHAHATGDDHPNAAEFCEEHQIAEAECPYCDPSLVESLGFCHGHGVPEAFCYRCNKDLIPAFKSVGDWCAGHDRPESQCYICNPELDPSNQPDPADDDAQASSTTDTPGTPAGAAGTAAGEPVTRAKRPPTAFCTTQNQIIRFDGPHVAKAAGLGYATVASREISRIVECNAEIDYDENLYAHLTPQVSGIVTEVRADLGDRVTAGNSLCVISSAQLGSAKAAFLHGVAAHGLREKNHAREVDLFERGLSSERKLLEAETELAESQISLSESEQELFSLGLTRGQMDEIRETGDTSTRYVVSAPFSGVVVERHAVLGEVVDASRALFAVTDISKMWALIDVYESDLREVKTGQPVVLQIEGLPGERFAGQIVWISSELDRQTRTLRARAELDNTNGRLRAHMFAQASIAVRDHEQAIVVPTNSVQWEGCCNIVFVKTSDSVFQPRKVHLGTSTGTVYEVLEGVAVGDEVVTEGSFLLKTELMKGSIGAGCCEVHPGT